MGAEAINDVLKEMNEIAGLRLSNEKSKIFLGKGIENKEEIAIEH